MLGKGVKQGSKKEVRRPGANREWTLTSFLPEYHTLKLWVTVHINTIYFKSSDSNWTLMKIFNILRSSFNLYYTNTCIWITINKLINIKLLHHIFITCFKSLIFKKWDDVFKFQMISLLSTSKYIQCDIVQWEQYLIFYVFYP